ncbi:MAG: methionine synthase [Dysgonamonadaceae bacterium]|jgi:5-methyltetrahydrofolate--homocysteine methyltransferase|nr:methionine synthase [Dysgonamonadaceae bacterium]
MLLIERLLSERILILDGGMGSMIQQYHLTEADYRGTTFAHLPGALQGNSEALNITRPDIIQAIHRQYLEAGADIIETNTLNATSISMADYGMENYVRELNLAAVRAAKEVVDRYSQSHPDQPRFVAGSVGPTNKTASLSPDVSNPAFRNITFDELYAAYREQMEALIDGGVDALLIETSFDTLNVKAALLAAEDSMTEKGKEVALMLSYTLAGKSGRILSGQTLEAASASVSHAKLLSIGLNCSFGAKDMKPFLKALGRIAPCYISAYPNAGLPNSLGQYDETAETMAAQVQEYLDEGLVNIIGGCCGTTPAHIAAIAQIVRQSQSKKHERNRTSAPGALQLSGLDALNVKPFTLIGERCNVAGSKKFLRLIQEKKYEEALNIARKQVDDGAQILDINVDDGLLDGVQEITHFLNLIASEPDIAKTPIMVDSSDWNIIEAGLKCLQGKSIVNSISLKNGEEDFLKKAKKVQSYGAAVIAMAFDEKGQADTFERKIEVCERMYRLLTTQAGFPPRNIIFDPNILAVGTGMEAHNRYAVDFIRATEWIKQNLPEARVSGGVSNLSFSFRGNNYLREAIHAVFLYHAIQKGMDMGIVNPSTAVTYEDIPELLRNAIEDLLFYRIPDATEKLMALAQTIAGTEAAHPQTGTQEEWRTFPVADRLKYALLKGIGDYLETDLQEALTVYPKPVTIIDQPLMEGMNAVGQLFGDGKMFLPQVVKTARTMKKAVAILQPYIEADRREKAGKAGKILIATVKGDVHDIGKNITGVILSCNNYEVIDLGVMVPPEEILQKAQEYQVDIIALSGLITPSLQEMSFVASEMEKAGCTKPLLVGGATTSPLHTALKIAPLYNGAVIHATDASKAIPGLHQILNPETQEAYIQNLKSAQQALRDKANHKKELVSLEYARAHARSVDHYRYKNPKPQLEGSRVIDAIPIQEVAPCIDWGAFLAAWKLPVRYARYTAEADIPPAELDKFREARQLMDEAKQIIHEWTERQADFIKAIIGFYPVRVEDESLAILSEKIPLLRQQEKREDDTYTSLVDFFHPEGDYIGLFTVTAGEKNHPKECHCGCAAGTEDPYREMLEQILKDRLAEAATEYLHEKVRNDYWGYATGESYLQTPHDDIRPASGYPSLPDLSLNFTIDKILGMHRIGVTLTSNGALYPNATTAGLFIAHPESNYFYIGAIGDDQLADYARKTGRSLDETRKWLTAFL